MRFLIWCVIHGMHYLFVYFRFFFIIFDRKRVILDVFSFHVKIRVFVCFCLHFVAKAFLHSIKRKQKFSKISCCI